MRSLHILVVDDEQVVLDSVTKHLKKESYTVYTALSVSDALALMEAHDMDVVLTDLMMPDIDGLEFMRLVKEKSPAVPVIMITGYATINTALQATQLGAFDYIAKPFTRKELQGVLHRAAGLVSAADAHKNGDADTDTGGHNKPTAVGDNSWLMLESDGNVLLGVEHSFLQTVGKVQTVYLPSVGDEVRQGAVYLQIFSSDMRSYSVLSPLSGSVVEVNQKVVDDAESALQDPFGDGWLIRLKPSRFDAEIKELGL